MTRVCVAGMVSRQMEIALPPFAFVSVTCLRKWQTALAIASVKTEMKGCIVTLSVNDIVVHDDIVTRAHYRIMRSRRSMVTSYGKDPINIGLVQSDLTECNSKDTAAATARFLVASIAHADYIRKNFLRLFGQELINPRASLASEISVSNSGLTTSWDLSTLSEYASVKVSTLDRVLEPIATRYEPSGNNSFYAFWRLNDDRLSDTYIGNPNMSVLNRSIWLDKRRALESALRNVGIDLANDFDHGFPRIQLYLGMRSATPDDATLAIANYRSLAKAINTYALHKTEVWNLGNLRRELLRSQESYQRVADNTRNTQNREKFSRFWNDIKSAQVVQSVYDASADWASIPLKASGTESSRTWGIEIETVRADETGRPAGWESKHDGSLPSNDADCSCDCSSCEDNEHCDDSDYGCYESGEVTYSSREFVSPILNSFNSEGLRRICNDLGTDEDEDSSPGIHVHVGAKDLTVFDITRLLVAYSAIERFIEPLLHRKERSYCKPTSAAQLQWWLASVRNWQRMNPNAVPTPADILYNRNDSTPDGRYVDVNIQSLTQHGTVEFRAMGAWYDYNHLVRWAWFAREMVNVSKLGIDRREWLACTSVGDVVSLLRKYGSEIPSDEMFNDIDSRSLVLTASEV